VTPPVRRRPGGLSTPTVFVTSIPVAFLSPLAAGLMWTLLVLARVATVWRERRPGS
jgi:hypothetical protein